tara:strand:- start:4370 stop:5890 length:1521 start_codon:yes stop_codon:yes gene_type:complete
MTLTIEDLATFCKRKGFVYPSGEIYGGLAGFFDFGHLGVELKNNLKQSWWKTFVQGRDDVVGIDGSIVTNPKVWKASGHVDGFIDILVDCKKCGTRFRGDHLIEDELNLPTAGMTLEGIEKTIKKNKLKCLKCKSELGDPKNFNLMFATNVGAIQDEANTAYLRPETAQLIFSNFKLVQENARMKLPFGIAQIGKAYRNEISPRDFLFRMREFEQMEIEYFIHPEKENECPYIKEVNSFSMNVLTEEMYEKDKKEKSMKVKDMLAKNVIKSEWHAYWIAVSVKWFVDLGAKAENFRIRQHTKSELSHYASDTWDIEYKFPFGWKELTGLANRADYDLKQHGIHSKTDLSLFDSETNQKVLPHVICEPSQGVERAFLVFLFDAYNDDKKRGNVVLKLHPKIAPVKFGVFPLVNKLEKEARKIYDVLRKDYSCVFDKGGSIGRRYARADEIGAPFCITVDFDSLKDKKVTIRDRDNARQYRVKVDDLDKVLAEILKGEKLEKFGKVVK